LVLPPDSLIDLLQLLLYRILVAVFIFKGVFDGGRRARKHKVIIIGRLDVI
jgi:hypothetical protein